MAQRARSNYKQVRLTFTEERGGNFTCRIMAKPLNEDWNMSQTIFAERFQSDMPLGSLQDVMRFLVAYLSQEPLP